MVFIPIWIIYGAAVIGVSYSILLAALFSRSVNITSDQRRASTHAASGYVLLVIPSLISAVKLFSKKKLQCFYDFFLLFYLLFQILLTKKLNGELQLSYSVINTPLLIALTSLVLRSFTGKGGNLCKYGSISRACIP